MYIFQKNSYVSDWHTLPCLCPRLSHDLILTKKGSICQNIILETPSKTKTSFANDKIYNHQLQ
jgi:hypothetical protein